MITKEQCNELLEAINKYPGLKVDHLDFIKIVKKKAENGEQLSEIDENNIKSELEDWLMIERGFTNNSTTENKQLREFMIDACTIFLNPLSFGDD